jgi:hypothetical protein
VLLLAFAFAVMGDPVSSVAYAVEAALRSLHGDLRLLLPTMAVVVACWRASPAAATPPPPASPSARAGRSCRSGR